MHTITINRDLNILEIRIEGFWSLADVATFAEDVKRSVSAITARDRQQSVLYDYTDARIQSQEVVKALQALASNDAFKSRKVACFTDGQMAKTQAQRIANAGSQIRVFGNRDDALAWLLAA